MKHLLSIITAVLLISNSGFVHAMPANPSTTAGVRSGIQWMTNYEKALDQAKATDKPLLLFFTGSDWCSWCNKLEEEVLVKKEFADAVGDQFIFVRLDFPLYHKVDNQLSQQNQKLRDRYNIKSFPTLLVLDDHEKVMGKSGYMEGGPKRAAPQLLAMIKGYAEYRKKCDELDRSKLSHAELRTLYEKAQSLQHSEEASELLALGLQNDHDEYFLCEQYRNFCDEGQGHTKEALSIRNSILEKDPSNLKHTHYKIAVIEYQSMPDEASPEATSAPLVAYLDKFGTTDKENRWKVEMTISQTYLAKGRFAEALEHAEVARESAPAAVKGDVEKAIEQIKAQQRNKGQ